MNCNRIDDMHHQYGSSTQDTNTQHLHDGPVFFQWTPIYATVLKQLTKQKHFNEIFESVLTSTMVVGYVQFLKEHKVFYQFFLKQDCLLFLINNKNEKLCLYK